MKINAEDGTMTILPHSPPLHMPERLMGLLLLTLTLWVYWPVRGFDFIAFDDPLYVVANNHLQAGFTGSGLIWAFTGFYASNWHPLTWLSHMLDVRLYGINPAGHHLTSAIIHGANSLLLFLILREATKARWRSFLVAALFALHPLHIESVAWVSERKDVLCAFFWMLTMYFYRHYALNPSLGRYLLALLGFSMGIMAKPMIITLPFVLVLFDFWPLGRYKTGLDERPDSKKTGRSRAFDSANTRLPHLLYEKIPFFILAAMATWLAYLAQSDGRAVQPWENLPLTTRIANALYSYGQYMAKTLWPQDLAVFYPHPGNTLDIWTIGASALLLCAITFLVCSGLRRRPYLAVGWFWFTGTLVPVIGIVQLGAQGMADRYTYLPSIGLFIILVWGASEFLEEIKVPQRLRAILSIALIAALLSGTSLQLRYWKNTSYLFNRALAVTSGNFMAHYILSTAGNASADDDSRQEHYRQAVAINPRFVAAQHNRTGYYLVEEGLPEAALTQFKMALRIDPNYARARNNLAVALARTGKFDEAIEQLTSITTKKNNYRPARDNLYNIYRDRAALSGKPLPHNKDAADGL